MIKSDKQKVLAIFYFIQNLWLHFHLYNKTIKRLHRQYFKISNDFIIFTYNIFKMTISFKCRRKNTPPYSLCECGI